MKKNNIIILSLLIFLTLGIVLFSYANQLTSLIAEAAATNPGHSWSQLECTTDLCVTSTGVGIGTVSPSAKLHVNGNIIASNPTAANHVATKDYVDNLPGLTWPDGGQPGDTLIMGVTGPFWDAPLTWSGSTKSEHDCDRIGGTIYDTGATGTICRYPGATVPAGWGQAGYWQRFHTSPWGGDDCGRFLSTGPTVFSNAAASYNYEASDCREYSSAYANCTNTDPSRWFRRSGQYVSECGIATVPTTTSNRAEVGIY